MAKFCAVCKRSYGDEHQHCPYCAARAAGDSGIDLGAALPPGGHSGSTSGGSVGSSSALSDIDWGTIGEEPPPSPPGKETTLAQGEAARPTMLAPHGELHGEPGAPAVPPGGPEEGSAVDLGFLAKQDEKASQQGSSSGSDLRSQVPAKEPPSSHVLAELAEEEQAQDIPMPGDEDELVGELFRTEAPPTPSMTPTQAQKPAHPDDSAIDLGAMPAASRTASDSEVFVAELASDVSHVELVSDVPPSGTSSRDRIAEEVESAALVPEHASDDIFDAAEVVDDQSSRVDLSNPDIEAGPALPVEEPAAPKVSQRRASEVDLGGLEVPPASNPELPLMEASAVDLGAHPEVEDVPISGSGLVMPADSGVNLGREEHVPMPADSGLALDFFLHDSKTANKPADQEADQEEEVPVVADAEEEPVAAAEEEDELFGADEAVAMPGDDEEEVVAAAAEEDDEVAGFPGMSKREVVEKVVSDAKKKEAAMATSDEDAEAAALAAFGDDEEAAVSAADEDEEPAVAAADEDEEPAVAAADEDEEAAVAAADEDEEPVRPSKPVKQRSRIPAFLAGGVLGSLACVGAWVGLVMGGLDPAPKLQELTGNPPKQAGAGPKTGPGTGVPPGPAAAPSGETQREWVKYGDYERARKAGYGESQATTPEELAMRGEYRWLSYLQQQRQADKPIDLKDQAVQAAVTDLQAAAKQVPEALFWLGYISEVANDPRTAAQYYNQGLQQFNDPQEKQRFQAALDRVQLQSAGKQGAFAVPAGQDRLAQLALLMIALQQPPDQPPPGQPPAGQVPPGQPPGQPPQQPQTSTEEAGFSFWQALKAARGQNYSAAVSAIDKAKKTHEDRRFLRLRRSQNPLTDPTEEIFLRACDELHAYWQLQDRLRQSGLMAKGQTPEQALTAASQRIKQGMAAEQTLQGISDSLAKEKVPGDDAATGVTHLLADRKAALKKIDGLQADLKKAKEDAAGLEEKLAAAENTVKDRDRKLEQAAKRETALTKAREAAEGSLKKVVDQLVEARYLDAKAGTDKVPEGLQKALAMAAIVDPQGLIRKLQGQVAQDEAELNRRHTPEEMLRVWLPVLQSQRQRKDLADGALEDVDRVMMDPRASAVQKAQAQLLRGLVLRNAERFEEARPVLLAARDGLAGERGAWLAAADVALQEVSNPAAHYLQRVDALYNQGKLEDALDALNALLPRLPKQEGELLARRSLLQLEIAQARATRRLRARDPQIAAASKDAAAAVASKTAAAAGYYASGRIAEELGEYTSAAQSYRQAVAAHRALDATGSEYRVALARVLVEQQNGQVPPAAVPQPQPQPQPRLPLPTEEDKGQPPVKPRQPEVRGKSPLQALKVSWTPPANCRAEDVQTLVILGLLALQAPDMVTPAIPDEADRMAEEILRAPVETIPFHVRAQALVIKGRWTTALQVYAEGLRPYLPRAYAQGLLRMILSHPRLRMPEVLRVPSPFLAEQRFGSGLTLYFNGEYAAAEAEFLAAVENYSVDARFYYFLGLARRAQLKREYVMDYEQAALLERQNRPSSAIISATLERVQGPYRYEMNRYRRIPRP